jgi:hypothetical protein
MATSGWTSYSPLATNTTPDLLTHDAYYVTATSPGVWLPSTVQGLAGLTMILFSRAIGRWLAGGLSDGDTTA